MRNAEQSLKYINENGQSYYGLMIVDSMVGGDDEQINFWMSALRGSLNSDPLYHGYIRNQFNGDG